MRGESKKDNPLTLRGCRQSLTESKPLNFLELGFSCSARVVFLNRFGFVLLLRKNGLTTDSRRLGWLGTAVISEPAGSDVPVKLMGAEDWTGVAGLNREKENLLALDFAGDWAAEAGSPERTLARLVVEVRNGALKLNLFLEEGVSCMLSAHREFALPSGICSSGRFCRGS